MQMDKWLVVGHVPYSYLDIHRKLLGVSSPILQMN